ncbi:MAG: hypothetical protein HY509_03855 [Acidobacteria bacterium]|nr:hypothetical protein [Acidobacteriota bacterium]
MQGWKRGRITAVAVVACGLAWGCAAHRAFRTAEKSAESREWDEAVLHYSKALTRKPGNSRYRVALARAKLRAGQDHFEKGRKLLEAGQVEAAIAELQQTVILDPGNQYAANELARAVEQYRERREETADLDTMKEKVREERSTIPRLPPGSNIPIVLKFRDEPIGKIYDALSKASGINFLFDERVDLNKKVTIEVTDVTFEKALDILMLQNKHFYTIWDENTLIVADDNRQKRQEYEDLVIQTFYLSNADVKDIQTLLRTLLDARQVVQNDHLNAITIRDTPERVAVAEQIVKLNDKAKAELVVDVALLELNRNVLRNLGIDLSSKTLGISFEGADAGLPLNNLDLLKQEGAWIVSPIPGFLLNFLRSDAGAQIIAKPQLRISEGEKASLRIGDRVPIPTTTFNTAGTVGGSIVPITSFTYQNVGINIDIEPRVHHNKEITLKLRVEVSSLSGTVAGVGGAAQPIIGTREIETTIRLRDGETNLLAGLIREEERTSVTSVPGLGDIPVLRRLFGNTDTQVQQTDIVLTMSPHIVRIADIREEDLRAMWIGTESNIRLRGAQSSIFSPSPFAGGGPEDYPPPPVEGEEAPAEAEKPSPPAAPAVEGAGGPAPAEGEGPEPEPGEELPPGGDAGLLPPEDQAGGEPAAPPAPSPPAPPSPARVILACGQALAGTNYQVIARILNGTEVYSVPYHLKFDYTILRFTGAQEGPFLGQGGVQTQFLHSVSTADPGEVFVGHSRVGAAQGASGGGILAYFNFEVLNPGETEIGFTNQAVLGANNAPLPATFHGCRVAVP